MSLVAEYILARKYDKVFFVYNKFKSAIAYDTVVTEVPLGMRAPKAALGTRADCAGSVARAGVGRHSGLGQVRVRRYAFARCGSVAAVTAIAGEQPEVLANLYEFRTAVKCVARTVFACAGRTRDRSLFAMIVEGATSEQSARMAAMDNSSKNAGEMIEKLRLQYNRTRQVRCRALAPWA